MRNKAFSLIKISGLSIGLVVCILIFLFSKDELSYDQFHDNKSQLFRVIQTWNINNDPAQVIGTTNSIIGETFKKVIPEVEQCVHINGGTVTVKNSNNDVITEGPLFVDENFFSVFSFPLVSGNGNTALKNLYSVVLTKDLAIKYYGSLDIIGKTMSMKIDEEFENFIITAIAENTPENSTIKSGIFLPFKNFERYNSNQDWIGGSMNTFLLLSPLANIKLVESKMQDLFDKNTQDDLAKIKQERGMAIKIRLELQPLTDIHLSKKAGPDNGLSDKSQSTYSYILSAIAIFILIIACINFINLSVAQSLKRSKEIGIRKVVGSTRKQLIRQFLVEAFLVSLIAFVIAIFVAYLILPFFNEIANKKLSFAYLSDGYMYAGLLLLLVVTALIAGFYPSLVLSRFRPVKVLYNKQRLSGKNYFTKSLIVLQFCLAIFLLIGTLAINSQMNFISRADLGYDANNLVRVTIPVRQSSERIPGLFKNELSGKQDILGIAARNGGRNISGAKVDGKLIEVEKTRIDEGFLPTFRIPVVAGRNFSADYPSDIMHAVIVNETFVKEAGWTTSTAIGKTLNFLRGEKKPIPVVGVVRDYHFRSMKEKIKPSVYVMDTGFNYGEVWVKIKPDNIQASLKSIESTFKKVVPFFPYSYLFMEDINSRNYESEAKWKLIIGISSGLFIFISCIGLLGLVMLSIEHRKKEIGIRKVLGAAVPGIILLISKEFISLILIGFLIAVPLCYYAIDQWLQEFAYRANIGWGVFALGGLVALVIALATITLRTFRTAMANPVKSLRTE